MGTFSGVVGSRERGILSSFIILLLFITPWLLFVWSNPKDWVGITIAMFTMYSTVVVKEVKNNKKVFFSVSFVLILHHAFAIINAYFMVTSGAEGDALWFQREAEIMAASGNIDLTVNGAAFYINFLAFFYAKLGSSHLLGMELSVLAFYLSIIVMLKILKVIQVKRYEGVLVLLYGCLPTVLMLSSLILRESWQMLFFMLVIYSSIRLRQTKKVRWFIALLLSMVLLAVWHNGFLAIAPFLGFIALQWAYGKKKRSMISWVIKIVIIAAIVLIGFRLSGYSGNSGAAGALTSGNALDYVEQYRMNSDRNAGASYVTSVNFGGTLGTVINIPIMFVMYMFAPMPWHIRGAIDIYAMAESLFRFILLVAAYKTWKRSAGEVKSALGFMVVSALLIEALWSMGTINWGTAMRHHLVAYPVLLCISGPLIVEKLKRGLIAIVK